MFRWVIMRSNGVDVPRLDEFNLMGWSHTIPLCNDVWLGMQARNIAIVDMQLIRQVETQALAEFLETEHTPVPTLMFLSAVSQMWVFSLYEFLRTWRQKAKEIIEVADELAAMPDDDRAAFLARKVVSARRKEQFVLNAPHYFTDQMAQAGDPAFVTPIRDYLTKSEGIFRECEALRVTLAKHEVPRTRGLHAETPGYGRMSNYTGSLYWHFVNKDGFTERVERRALSDAFFDIDDG